MEQWDGLEEREERERDYVYDGMDSARRLGGTSGLYHCIVFGLGRQDMAYGYN